MTVSDLTLSNSWATNTMILWIFRARRKKRSFGKNSLATSAILLIAFGSLGWSVGIYLRIFHFR